MTLFNNVAIQWLIRQVPEWSSLIVTIITFSNAIPPELQAVIVAS